MRWREGRRSSNVEDMRGRGGGGFGGGGGFKLGIGGLIVAAADYFLGVDGISLPLVILTTVMSPIAMLASFGVDRRVKMPLYARGGIREAWLCDLTTARVDVHRDVTAGRYASVRSFTATQRLSVDALRDIAVTVAELLG